MTKKIPTKNNPNSIRTKIDRCLHDQDLREAIRCLADAIDSLEFRFRQHVLPIFEEKEAEQ